MAYKNFDAKSLSAHPALPYSDYFELPYGLADKAVRRLAVIGCSEMGTHGPLIPINSNDCTVSFHNFGNHFENDETIKTTTKEKINPINVKDFYVMLRVVAASRKTSNRLDFSTNARNDLRRKPGLRNFLNPSHEPMSKSKWLEKMNTSKESN